MNPITPCLGPRAGTKNVGNLIWKCAAISLLGLLAACGEEETGEPSNIEDLLKPVKHPLGGTITGNSGTVTLLESNHFYRPTNPNKAIIFKGDSEFVFQGYYPRGDDINVYVAEAPAGQTCTVLNGVHQFKDKPWYGLQVVCHNMGEPAPPAPPVLSSLTVNLEGSETDLLPPPVITRNNGERITNILYRGPYSFERPVRFGESYAVSVLYDLTRICTVTNGTGVGAGVPIDVGVYCSTKGSRLGGIVSGLTGTLKLNNTDGQSLDISSNGTFTFPSLLASGSRYGSPYSVSVVQQPSGQICSISGASGIVESDVSSVLVTCTSASQTWQVGGSVSGLTGTLKLSNTDGQSLSTTANGAFAFANSLPNGSSYGVSVAQQPAGQICSISGASGTATTNVSNIVVTCAAQTWRLGASVSGLTGTLKLSNADGQSLTVTADGNSVFPVLLAHGSSYNVSVAQQPSGQTCSVSGASGTITADVSVAVLCQSASAAKQFLYVANNGSSNVSAYSINATTGALSIATGSPIAAGAGPVAAAADPLGRFAFFANQGGGSVSAFAVNATTGGLTPVLGSPFAAITSINGLTVDPAGKYVYVANGDKGVLAYSIGAAGALTPMAGSPFSAGVPSAEVGTYAVAVDPSGRFAYVANANFMANSISAFSIGATGALTPMAGGATPAGQYPNALVIDAAGKFLYAANYVSNNVSVYAIGATGTLTQVVGSPFAAGSGPQSITLASSGKFAYVANNGATTVSAYSINPTTGALTPIAGSPFTAGSSPASVTSDTSGKFLYVANYGSNNISAFAIDSTTGG